MTTREEFDQLVERIDRLETLVKNLIRATDHIHNWNRTGEHDTQNVKRQCGICNKYQKYVYPMRAYEDFWEDCYHEESS